MPTRVSPATSIPVSSLTSRRQFFACGDAKPRIRQQAERVLDVERHLIGVGAGPANLSLASLLTTARERRLVSVTAAFFECEATVFWHSLQMFPETVMQTEFYRALVTPIDPTCKFSFLNYLKAQARLDQFFCSSTIYPTRREFQDYFMWVAGQIGDVIFGVRVNCVDYDAKKTCSSSM